MSLYKVSERREALLSIYQYLLTVSTGREISGPNWKRALDEVLNDDPSPNGIRKNDLLPQLLDNYGTVDSVYGFFEVAPRSQGPIGVWFSSIVDSWCEVKPEERLYKPADWEVPGKPGMVVYIWSERSQIKNRTRYARLADFADWNGIMQVRVLEWQETDDPSGNKYPRQILHDRDVMLKDIGLRRDMMFCTPEDILEDPSMAAYQGRFDERVQRVLACIESDKRIRANKVPHEQI